VVSAAQRINAVYPGRHEDTRSVQSGNR